MTSLVIVDDHEALREGLAALVTSHDIEVLGAAATVAAGRDLLKYTDPDVALVDTRLPDGSGIDLTRELLARRPELGVILYTGDADADLLYSALNSGARGYALKAGPMSELVGAIEPIASGGSYVDPRLDRILFSPRDTARVPSSRRASGRSSTSWPKGGRPRRSPTSSAFPPGRSAFTYATSTASCGGTTADRCARTVARPSARWQRCWLCVRQRHRNVAPTTLALRLAVSIGWSASSDAEEWPRPAAS